MKRSTVIVAIAAALVVAGVVAGVAGGGAVRQAVTGAGASGPRSVGVGLRPRAPDPVALVTAETRNQLVVVDLVTGVIRHRVRLPPGPENVVARGVAVVVSPGARSVTLLRAGTLQVIVQLRGFTAPHIPVLAPGGDYAYITDDGAGTVTPIRLSDGRERASLVTGRGAHHLAFSPDGRRAWVALGESARTIVFLDTGDLAHPRVVGRLRPPVPAHDVAFDPTGRTVWVSSATTSDVAVIDARTLRVRFRIAVGPPPQHMIFSGTSAYLTSGYGGTLERVDATSGRILARTRSPYGSFELDAGAGHVATSSLLRGTLAVYDLGLHLQRVVPLAPATRDLAIESRWP